MRYLMRYLKLILSERKREREYLQKRNKELLRENSHLAMEIKNLKATCFIFKWKDEETAKGNLMEFLGNNMVVCLTFSQKNADSSKQKMTIELFRVFGEEKPKDAICSTKLIRHKDCIEIEYIEVDTHQINRGYGSKMMEFLIKYAKSQSDIQSITGMMTMQVLDEKHQSRLRYFYREKYGFQISDDLWICLEITHPNPS